MLVTPVTLNLGATTTDAAPDYKRQNRARQESGVAAPSEVHQHATRDSLELRNVYHLIDLPGEYVNSWLSPFFGPTIGCNPGRPSNQL